MEFVWVVVIALQVVILYMIFSTRKEKKGQAEPEMALVMQNVSSSLWLEIKQKLDQQQKDLETSLAAQKFETKETLQKSLSELQTTITSGLNLMQNTQKDLNQKEVLLLGENYSKMQTQMDAIKLGLLESQGELQKKIQTILLGSLESMQKQTHENLLVIGENTQKKLDQINLEVGQRLDSSFSQHLKSFQEVTQAVGKIQALTARMIDSTVSIDKLNSVFERTSSKAFGGFSEKYLESLLTEHLNTQSFSSQVTMPGSSNKIDFVIYLGNRKIGIDSKFPLTKYQDFLDAPSTGKEASRQQLLKAVAAQAKDMSQKYGGMGLDVLLMYLPSDSLYSEIVNDEKISSEMQSLKVTPTSPNTIFPLIIIIQSLQLRQQVSEQAEMIIDGLRSIGKNVESFQNEFRKMGDKLRQAQQNYDTADRSLYTINSSIARLQTTTDGQTLAENLETKLGGEEQIRLNF